jgi:ectoine hydroxylase-related dioxygenase (phytanoyl-CoA dioxygenase family)
MGINRKKITFEEREQLLKELKIYGYCIVPQYIEPESVVEIKQRLFDFWEEDKAYGGRPEGDDDNLFVYNLHCKDMMFIDLISFEDLHEIFMRKLNDPYYRFLPADVPNYYLSAFQARSSGNKLDLHIDTIVPFPGERTTMMQMAFVLEDQNENNGCTTVVPGSHLSGEFTDREMKNIKPIIAQAGDLVIWDSRLWHGTLDNHSGESRWLLLALWVMWWIKPYFDILSLPEEFYSQLDDRQKQLLGFCCIPPINEDERINTKCGYETLRPSVSDYKRN